ncbi:MAG: hypothetical protein RIR70_1120, partial [Pseudomonadota bacterium]
VLTRPAVWGGAAGLGLVLLGWFAYSLIRSRRKVVTLRPMKEATAEPSDSLARRLRSARESMASGRAEEGAERKSPIVQVLEVDDPVVSGAALPATPVAPSAPAARGADVARPEPVDTPKQSVPQAASQSSEPAVEAPVQAPGVLPEPVAVVTASPSEPAAETNLASAAPHAVSALPVSEPVVVETLQPVAPAETASEPERSSRTSIHLELLRVYAARKEIEQFDALAQELYRLSEGKGADWLDAATLGRSIDPGNPVYALPDTALEPAPRAPAEHLIETQSAAQDAPQTLTEAVQAPALPIEALQAPVPQPAPTEPRPSEPQPGEPQPGEPQPGEPDPAQAVGLPAVQPPVQSPVVEAQVVQAPSPILSSSPPAGVWMPDPFAGVDFDFGDFSSSLPKASKPAPVVTHPAPPVQPVPPASQDDPPAAPLEAKMLDLSGISLDLPKPPAPPPAPVEEKLDEVGAKLELARAYHEMGDKDGARELLTEVVNEGNATQQAAAREMLGKLA